MAVLGSAVLAPQTSRTVVSVANLAAVAPFPSRSVFTSELRAAVFLGRVVLAAGLTAVGSGPAAAAVEPHKVHHVAIESDSGE